MNLFFSLTCFAVNESCGQKTGVLHFWFSRRESNLSPLARSAFDAAAAPKRPQFPVDEAVDVYKWDLHFIWDSGDSPAVPAWAGTDTLGSTWTGLDNSQVSPAW